MKFSCAHAAVVLAGLLATGSALAEPWSPEPWLADLEQIRQALDTKYANRDWLIRDREFDLAAMLDGTAKRLREASSDAEARAALDRLMQRIADGHVGLQWPNPAGNPSAPQPTVQPIDGCSKLGYDARHSSPGVAPSLSGFRRIGSDGDLFPIGILDIRGTRVGVLRITMFHPHGWPQLCKAAFTELELRTDQACDERCADAVLTWSYDRLTRSLEDQLRVLQTAGAKQLLVDITANGGGSEWVEAIARIISPRPVQSPSWGFVRGDHWAKHWDDVANEMRKAAATASSADKNMLLAWAAEADSAKQMAQTPCDGRTGCEWIGRAGFATGLVGSAPAGTFDGKPWAVHVFSPAQYPYHDSVWRGPVMVLVDQYTGSAAETFASLLQDNHAAVIVGTRTAGAGCGYTNGGTPTTLNNSRAVLRVPDCVRFRADGSNEVNGVIPDVLVGMRGTDGVKFKAKLIDAKLPEASQLAAKLSSAQ